MQRVHNTDKVNYLLIILTTASINKMNNNNWMWVCRVLIPILKFSLTQCRQDGGCKWEADLMASIPIDLLPGSICCLSRYLQLRMKQGGKRGWGKNICPGFWMLSMLTIEWAPSISLLLKYSFKYSLRYSLLIVLLGVLTQLIKIQFSFEAQP